MKKGETQAEIEATYGGGGGLDILLLLSLLINFGSPWGNSAFEGARNCIDGLRTSSFKFPGRGFGFATVLRLGNPTETVSFSTTGLEAGEDLMWRVGDVGGIGAFAMTSGWLYGKSFDHLPLSA